MDGDAIEILSRDVLVSAVSEIQKANGRPFKKRFKTLRVLIGYLKAVADRAEKEEDVCRQIVDSFDEMPRLVGEAVVMFLNLADDHGGGKNVIDLGVQFSDVLESMLASLMQWCDGDPCRPMLTSLTMPLLNEILRVTADNARDWKYILVVGTPLAFFLWNMANCDAVVIKEWSVEVLPFIRKIVQGLALVGDFTCQYRIVVLLLQWLSWIDRDVAEKFVDKYFHMMESCDRDILFGISENLDLDYAARRFIGALNTNPMMTKKNPVMSVPCKFLFAGQEQLLAPQNVEEYWVDFSVKSRRIHVFFSLPDMDWIDLNISADNIESTCIAWGRRKDSQNFSIPDFNTQNSDMTGISTSAVCFLHICLKEEFSSLSYELQRFSKNETHSLTLAFCDVPTIEDTLAKMKFPVHNHDKKMCGPPKTLIRLIRGEETCKTPDIPSYVKDEPLSPSQGSTDFVSLPSSTLKKNDSNIEEPVQIDTDLQSWVSETPVRSAHVSKTDEDSFEEPNITPYVKGEALSPSQGSTDFVSLPSSTLKKNDSNIEEPVQIDTDLQSWVSETPATILEESGSEVYVSPESLFTDSDDDLNEDGGNKNPQGMSVRPSTPVVNKATVRVQTGRTPCYATENTVKLDQARSQTVEDTSAVMKFPVHNHDKKMCGPPKTRIRLIRGKETCKTPDIPSYVKNEPLSPSQGSTDFVSLPSSTLKKNDSNIEEPVQIDTDLQSWVSETPATILEESGSEVYVSPESLFTDSDDDLNEDGGNKNPQGMSVRPSTPVVNKATVRVQTGRTPCYATENIVKLDQARSQALEDNLGTCRSEFMDPYDFSKSWDFFNGSKIRTYGSKKKRPLNQTRRASSSRKRRVTGHRDQDDELDQLLAKLPARDKTLGRQIRVGDKKITRRRR